VVEVVCDIGAEDADDVAGRKQILLLRGEKFLYCFERK